jgi:ABC-type polysaccharide/polyol phosphate transport system ATPase subunit
MLGRNRSELRGRVDAIAEWAQLGDFIDVPVRTYSSGMLARLGFAVATDVAPDVLIVDEALAVGDEAFRRRSSDRLEQLIATGSAVLLVSHNIEDVRRRSARVLWLDQGQVHRLGDPGEVIDEYSAAMAQRR